MNQLLDVVCEKGYFNLSKDYIRQRDWKVIVIPFMNVFDKKYEDKLVEVLKTTSNSPFFLLCFNPGTNVSYQFSYLELSVDIFLNIYNLSSLAPELNVVSCSVITSENIDFLLYHDGIGNEYHILAGSSLFLDFFLSKFTKEQLESWWEDILYWDDMFQIYEDDIYEKFLDYSK